MDHEGRQFNITFLALNRIFIIQIAFSISLMQTISRSITLSLNTCMETIMDIATKLFEDHAMTCLPSYEDYKNKYAL